MRGEIRRKEINNWNNHMLFHFQEGKQKTGNLPDFACTRRWSYSLCVLMLMSATYSRWAWYRSQMCTPWQHLANELYKWKFSKKTIFRFRRTGGGRKPRTRCHGGDLLAYCSSIHARQRCLSPGGNLSTVKLLSITMRGKWNQPPTVRKMLLSTRTLNTVDQNSFLKTWTPCLPAPGSD